MSTKPLPYPFFQLNKDTVINVNHIVYAGWSEQDEGNYLVTSIQYQGGGERWNESFQLSESQFIRLKRLLREGAS